MTPQFYGPFFASWVVLSLVGCGRPDNTLQQQKQLLEAMRLQQETLVVIDQKQKLLREQEQAQETRLKEIAERETALRNQETHNNVVLAEITSRQEQVKILADKVEEQNRRTEYFAQLASRRLPYLQRLAIEAARAFEETEMPSQVEEESIQQYVKSKVGLEILGIRDQIALEHKLRREHYYPIILNLFYENHVQHIEADAAAELAAYKLIESYLLQLVEKESDEQVVMDKIREAMATSSKDRTVKSDGAGGEGAAMPVPAVNVPSYAVSKGSFSAWTEPRDPDPGRQYVIVIQVRLPKSIREYPGSDLTGKVIGTDLYKQDIKFKSTDKFPVKDGAAQVQIPVPGAAKLVRDTIQIESRLLGEKQTILIEF